MHQLTFHFFIPEADKINQPHRGFHVDARDARYF